MSMVEPSSAPSGDEELPHVLVVDDDDFARESLAAILAENHRVSTASSGEEAIAILEKSAINVICTDLQMPKMNGIELLRKAATLAPRTIGVLVTGFPEIVSNRDARDQYLLVVKPFAPEKLLNVVSQAVRFSRIRSLLTTSPPTSRSRAL
jgi:DNA-binding NtrC family response regulator